METVNEPVPAEPSRRSRWVSNLRRFSLSNTGQLVTAGLLLAFSLPPWGWWPLAFIGIALLDDLLVDQSRRTRFVRTTLAAAVWLYVAMLWMIDLTLPGYLIAGAVYALYFGVAAAIAPNDRSKQLVLLPLLFALAEFVRWRFPFGGVPLANIALSQVESPLAPTARLAGPYLIIVLVVVIGQALVSLRKLQVKYVVPAVAVVLIAIGGALAHPRATDTGTLTAAAVQGGGPQRTRADSSMNPTVLARHAEATRYIDEDVDLVLWPENVVNPGQFLSLEAATELVSDAAVDVEATLLAGWFYKPPGSTNTVNYQNAVDRNGNELGRYAKVRTVPFGEFVPLRGLIEIFNSEIPNQDVIPGDGPPNLETDEGNIGVAISWEAYFERRTRDAIANGAEILTNPTNGSSYWLTQVQTQQVASNQLRAIEGDRWLLMTGPTGLGAFIDPDGRVVQRTDISDRVVLIQEITRREGRTLFSYVGAIPLFIALFIAGLWASGLGATLIDRLKTRRQASAQAKAVDTEVKARVASEMAAKEEAADAVASKAQTSD